MIIETFELERFQSLYEHHVDYNLSESGVEPLRVEQLIQSNAEARTLLQQQLSYVQTNGTVDLRQRIAALYPGATEDDILVTTGCAEANFLVSMHLADPEAEAVVLLPNYMQTWGLLKGFGARVKAWPLVADFEAGRWRPDFDALESMVGPQTKMIFLCNPNNPTGGTLEAEELDQIVSIAERHGAWILADEIYRGAELGDAETASLWGRYDRVFCTAGLSKAYGLPGLRIGWVVGPRREIEHLWSHHDYTTIAPAALSDHLAALALGPKRQEWLLERTRKHIRTNYAAVAEWLADHRDHIDHLPPRAGAIAYLRYRHPVNSTELAERLRREKSTLIVPGDHFGMDGHLRIGFGPETDYLKAGLSRLTELLRELS